MRYVLLRPLRFREYTGGAWPAQDTTEGIIARVLDQPLHIGQTRTMTTAQALPSGSVAPWAEIVHGVGPVTVGILLTLLDDGYVYEVVEGVLVRVAGSGNRATRLALRLGALLLGYVEPRRLGVVTGADGVYRFPGAETGLLPDVGFYLAERLPLITDEDKPIPFVSDLAVEVVSPSQDAAEIGATCAAVRAWCGWSGPSTRRSMSGAPTRSMVRSRPSAVATCWTART